MSKKAKELTAYVLLDTNVFAERTRLLRTGLGSTLIYFAKVRSVKILFPEVIESEARRYATNEVARLADEMNSLTRELREWVGQASDPRLPSAESVIASFDARLAELSRWLERRPNSSALIERAAERVFKKIAPSHRDGHDAFKDCLIWESVLSLPRGSCIDLVSNDARAFFDLKDQNALHPALREEARSTGLKLNAHRDLGSLLRGYQRSAPPLDAERAAVAVNAVLAEHFIHVMNQWNLDGLSDEVFHFDPYVTEEPGILHLEFSVEARANGTAELGGTVHHNPSVRLTGSCRYDPHGPVRDVQLTRIALLAANNGVIHESKHGYLRATSSTHRPFQMRRALKDISEPNTRQESKPDSRRK